MGQVLAAGWATGPVARRCLIVRGSLCGRRPGPCHHEAREQQQGTLRQASPWEGCMLRLQMALPRVPATMSGAVPEERGQ